MGSKGGVCLCDAESDNLFSCPLTFCFLGLSAPLDRALLLLAGQLSFSEGPQPQRPCRRSPRAERSRALRCAEEWCKKPNTLWGPDGGQKLMDGSDPSPPLLSPPLMWGLLHFWLLPVQPEASAARGMGSLSFKLHLFLGGEGVCVEETQCQPSVCSWKCQGCLPVTPPSLLSPQPGFCRFLWAVSLSGL